MRYQAQVSMASPLQLHSNELERTDANSPVFRHAGRAYVFVSHYLPIGHTYRRTGDVGLKDMSPLRRVRIVDDPTPSDGKWIESVWRDDEDHLFGWFHTETLAPCPETLFVPSIGALVSNDGGISWRMLGSLLRADPSQLDCSYRNGFFAGGVGDFSVIPDRSGSHLYIHHTSYVRDEALQGIVVARYPVARRHDPVGSLEVWAGGAWKPAAGALPTPFWPMGRGWRHPDPIGFWGPAVHYNRHLDAHVMLLNRTQDAKSDLRQEGIYVSFNPRIEDPSGWTPPVCIVKGGFWYPEAIGMGETDGDTVCDGVARLFMMGFSVWQIAFDRVPDTQAPPPPFEIGREDINRSFGTYQERRTRSFGP